MWGDSSSSTLEPWSQWKGYNSFFGGRGRGVAAQSGSRNNLRVYSIALALKCDFKKYPYALLPEEGQFGRDFNFLPEKDGKFQRGGGSILNPCIFFIYTIYYTFLIKTVQNTEDWKWHASKFCRIIWVSFSFRNPVFWAVVIGFRNACILLR